MDRVRFIKKCDESTLTHACALLSRATHRSALGAQHVRRLVVLRERNLGVARDEAYDSLALYPANAGTFRVFQTIDDVVVGILPVAVSHQLYSQLYLPAALLSPAAAFVTGNYVADTRPAVLAS